MSGTLCRRGDDGIDIPGAGNDYTFVKAPVIHTLVPESCLVGISAWVTIVGSGFEGVQQVWFVDPGQHAQMSPEWHLISSTEIQALTPIVDTAGVYEMQVSTFPGGTSVGSGDAATFLFLELIQISP